MSEKIFEIFLQEISSINHDQFESILLAVRLRVYISPAQPFLVRVMNFHEQLSGDEVVDSLHHHFDPSDIV